VVDGATLPDCFEVTARCGDLIMGMRHRDAPLEGVQFHPESVLTQEGYRMVANWLTDCGATSALERADVLVAASERTRAALPSPSLS
jgi:para-aminobenzoate synthetase component 2